MPNIKKLVVILGPTATGKSELGVKLAKKYGGEIISADSRQVYRGLDIGTAKITKKDMDGVPHHLLDVASPKRKFTVAQYQKLATKKIKQIHEKGKIPFLVGGSALYIYSVTDNWSIPEVKPNEKLRKQLERFGTEELFQKLQKLDPRRAQTFRQNSGQEKNRRRLIRALEIVLTTKKPIAFLRKNPFPYPVLFLGIKKSPEKLKKRIAKRLKERLKGIIREAKGLKEKRLSWKRLEEFGLEYRFAALYLQKKISRGEMQKKIVQSSLDFARRQMTWFKKDTRIHWTTNVRQAEILTKNFLK